jgi:serine/threonine-protein kinase RsbW
MSLLPRRTILSRVSTRQTRTFPARLAEASNLSGFVASAVSGMDEERLAMRLRLAVEELFVNTVTHGHGGDSDAVVEVTVSIDGDRVVLIYEDHAPPFDPFASVERPDAAATIEARDVGRLGLFLITQVAAQCRYERTGDRNCITVELPAAQPSRGTRSAP